MSLIPDAHRLFRISYMVFCPQNVFEICRLRISTGPYRAGIVIKGGNPMNNIQSVSKITASAYPQPNRSTKKASGLSQEDERALEMLSRYQESKEASKKNKKPVEYNGSELTNKLSAARGRMDILMVISDCYKTLSDLLAALSMDSGDNKKIRGYIAHVKKIIQSAEKKLSHVASEEEMECRIQSAKKREAYERLEESLKKKKMEKRQQALKAERAKKQTDELLDTYKKKKKRHINEEKKDIQRLKKTHPDNDSGIEDLLPLPGITSGSSLDLSGFAGTSALLSQATGITVSSQAAGIAAYSAPASGAGPSVSEAGGSSAPVSLDVVV